MAEKLLGFEHSTCGAQTETLDEVMKAQLACEPPRKRRTETKRERLIPDSCLTNNYQFYSNTSFVSSWYRDWKAFEG